MSRDRECFQCGRPIHLVLPEDASDDAWFTCEGCGERIMSVEEFAQQVREAQEEHTKRALGFYDFKPSE